MTRSRVFESYCADIDSLLRDGQLRSALRFSLALPDICVALEEAQMSAAPHRYAAWCATWLHLDRPAGLKVVDGKRVHRFYMRVAGMRSTGALNMETTADALRGLRLRRRARGERALGRSRVWQPTGTVQSFKLSLSEGLVAAARRWYREHGASDRQVQHNLGQLAVSG